jgi:8-oxo-dGTP diphosphatase
MLCRGMNRERVVAAAIIRKNGSVLIARRSAGQKLAGFWEFPGGKVEEGETPEECLARELAEELGILTRIGEKCAESLHQYDHGNFRVVAYLVDCIGGEPRPTVHDRLDWVEIDDLRGYQLAPADIGTLGNKAHRNKDHRLLRGRRNCRARDTKRLSRCLDQAASEANL